MSVDDGLQMLDVFKHPALLVHQEEPLNAGTPPELARQSFITPQVHFFVRNHASVPRVSEYRYFLSVTGMVWSPLKFSLPELKEEFRASTVIAALQCAGHRRSELAAIEPIHGFPLRVVVPGYVGARSVKWLANIHVQEQPSTNYFQRKAYKLFSRDVLPEVADWKQGKMLGDLPLNSLIVFVK